MYICKDNYKLIKIEKRKSILNNWENYYIGRKIIKDKFEENFFNNEYIIEDGCNERGIYSSFTLKIDNNDIVQDVRCIKYSENGGPRANVDEYRFTKKEISESKKILDEVTVDHFEDEYKQLVEKIQSNNNIINEQYTLNSVLKTSLKINDFKINKKTIKDYIIYLHNYYEISFDKELINFLFDDITEQETDVLLSLSKLMDITSFDDYEELVESYNCLNDIDSVENGYNNLLEAVKNNDLKKSEQYKCYAKFFKSGYTPLKEALNNKNTELVRLLLENGAYSFCDSDRAYSYSHIGGNNIKFYILDEIKEQNLDNIKLLCEHNCFNGDYANFEGNNDYRNYIQFLVLVEVSKTENIDIARAVLPYIPYKDQSPRPLLDFIKFMSSNFNIEDIMNIKNIQLYWNFDNCLAAKEKGDKYLKKYFDLCGGIDSFNDYCKRMSCFEKNDVSEMKKIFKDLIAES